MLSTIVAEKNRTRDVVTRARWLASCRGSLDFNWAEQCRRPLEQASTAGVPLNNKLNDKCMSVAVHWTGWHWYRIKSTFTVDTILAQRRARRRGARWEMHGMIRRARRRPSDAVQCARSLANNGVRPSDERLLLTAACRPHGRAARPSVCSSSPARRVTFSPFSTPLFTSHVICHHRYVPFCSPFIVGRALDGLCCTISQRHSICSYPIVSFPSTIPMPYFNQAVLSHRCNYAFQSLTAPVPDRPPARSPAPPVCPSARLPARPLD